MRVLWVSNAPWTPTGYGQQTALVCRRLAADGHDVAIAANYGLQGRMTRWEGIEVLPQGFDQYGNDIIPMHAEYHRADWLVTLYDVWAFKATAQLQTRNVAAWTPVDHRPVPPAVAEWFHRSGAVPIAMSQFGRDQLARRGLEPLYVPHGVDLAAFNCDPDPAEARDLFNIPADSYCVVMNAANKGHMPRKGWPEAFLAFGELARRHPDAVLFVHAEQFGAMGLNLDRLADACAIPREQIRWIDAYALMTGALPPQAIARLYRAGDVLLAPSRGEGFGIPVLEAQACGRPVIVSDATAQSELCGDGWLLPGEPEWDEAQESWWHKANVQATYEALEAAYDRGRADSAKAVEFAAQYDADLLHEQMWRPIMAELAERTPTMEPVPS